MIAEEQEILDWFERGELRPASDADRESEVALQAAHNTLADWFERGKLCSASDADREHTVVLQAAHNTLADWFERGELCSASDADRERKVALQAARNTYPHNTLDELLEALGRRLKIIAEFLKGRPLVWAVPAMAMILAIAWWPPPLGSEKQGSQRESGMVLSMPAESQGSHWESGMALSMPAESQGSQREPVMALSMPAESQGSQREPVMAHSAHATDKIPLLVGTEERLKEDGFLKTDHRFFRRKYEMVTEPKIDDPQVKIVSIGERLSLRPGQELKVLIGLSGELKKGSDYQVEKSQDTTFITFTNDILSGEAVLVVVEAKN